MRHRATPSTSPTAGTVPDAMSGTFCLPRRLVAATGKSVAASGQISLAADQSMK
jgi:hypothetical protein